jgi:predicted nucleic acid-binding protein
MGDLPDHGERAGAHPLESGVIRDDGPTLQDAVSRLRQFCSAADHSFWPDTTSVRAEDRFRLNHVQGYRQLTDVYLLALVVEKEGRLATFDGSIPLRSVARAVKTHDPFLILQV